MTDIGKTLQNARNEKHYTLDDLQQINKIKKKSITNSNKPTTKNPIY